MVSFQKESDQSPKLVSSPLVIELHLPKRRKMFGAHLFFCNRCKKGENGGRKKIFFTFFLQIV